jgi:DNA polymerase-3 subunit beta
MQIGFNAKFLIEMLGAIGADDILLKLDSPNRAGIMVPSKQDEGEDLMMLVMPVMINH